MQTPAKAFVVTLVSAVTFAFGAAPAAAASATDDYGYASAAVQPSSSTQVFSASSNALETQSLDSLLVLSDVAQNPHNFNVEAAIAAAKSEIGTSRPTGWSQPGECIMSVQRWVKGAGGANWIEGGSPRTNYNGATRLTIEYAQPGDVVQYEHIMYPDSWVSGVHTVLITGVNGDGTFEIVESNIPFGSGLVRQVDSWVPEPPAGFQAVVWRF